MKILREEFKAQAKANENIFKDVLGDDFENLWNFVSKCSECLNICLNKTCYDEKKLYLIIMLRNLISDILCCLDAIERGHEQTVANNLRMTLEGFCLVFHMHKENSVFEDFKHGKHDTPKSVTYTTKFKPSYNTLGRLYGELSKISHQSRFDLIARQIIERPNTTAIFSHIKPINQSNFKSQTNFLLLIILILRSIAELAEEICINNLEQPYFWKKNESGFQQKLNTKEDEFMHKFCMRAKGILNV